MIRWNVFDEQGYPGILQLLPHSSAQLHASYLFNNACYIPVNWCVSRVYFLIHYVKSYTMKKRLGSEQSPRTEQASKVNAKRSRNGTMKR